MKKIITALFLVLGLAGAAWAQCIGACNLFPPGLRSIDRLAFREQWKPSTNSRRLHEGRHDRPLPYDYDGDGRTDMAVWRPDTGEWIVINSLLGKQGWSNGECTERCLRRVITTAMARPT